MFRLVCVFLLLVRNVLVVLFLVVVFVVLLVRQQNLFLYVLMYLEWVSQMGMEDRMGMVSEWG